ncbi:adenylate isopentenyltransferase 3, chloroplastic-like [Humulus lupulus]|uniref:adenylate isopentenyltransferase 3, chloroplastic-like n=1 Tax=Humulus lupulus TaxID=3486 RepID=UPI002B411666|nr:adenylate isopentenyltransferase 3, chloroplastic-like [Humulus lupulus]
MTISSTKPKVIFIMGATGTGKSKLSIDLATSFPCEIINSDKIQVYEGLDIVTNKLRMDERCGIPHHLLGVISNPNADFTPEDFINHVHASISDITHRGRTPIIVGGSNSYLKALVDNNNKFQCCFLCLDVSLDVLFQYVDDRVDQMVEEGLVNEISTMYEPGIDCSRGIWRAIGVCEMKKYLNADEKEEALLREAIENTKYNTRSLVCRQRSKIQRLRDEHLWEIQWLDATPVFEKRNRGEDKMEVDKAWNQFVLNPSLEIVTAFLRE